MKYIALLIFDCSELPLVVCRCNMSALLYICVHAVCAYTRMCVCIYSLFGLNGNQHNTMQQIYIIFGIRFIIIHPKCDNNEIQISQKKRIYI